MVYDRISNDPTVNIIELLINPEIAFENVLDAMYWAPFVLKMQQ